jgi:hypothetical protein
VQQQTDVTANFMAISACLLVLKAAEKHCGLSLKEGVRKWIKH